MRCAVTSYCQHSNAFVDIQQTRTNLPTAKSFTACCGELQVRFVVELRKAGAGRLTGIGIAAACCVAVSGGLSPGLGTPHLASHQLVTALLYTPHTPDHQTKHSHAPTLKLHCLQTCYFQPCKTYFVMRLDISLIIS